MESLSKINLWAALFISQVITAGLARAVPPTAIFYVVTIISAVCTFFWIRKIAKNSIGNDILNLCYLDVFVQSFGVFVYFSDIPTLVYAAPNFGIILAGIFRFVWLVKGADGSYKDWPSIGPFGWNKVQISRYNMLVYGLLLACVAFGGLFQLVPNDVKLAVMAMTLFPLTLVATREDQEKESRIAQLTAQLEANGFAKLNPELHSKLLILARSNHAEDVILVLECLARMQPEVRHIAIELMKKYAENHPKFSGLRLVVNNVDKKPKGESNGAD